MNFNPADEDDRLMDFKEVSHLLGDISERSIRRMIASGDLPQPVKVRNAPRLYHSDVTAYLKNLKRRRTLARARKSPIANE